MDEFPGSDDHVYGFGFVDAQSLLAGSAKGTGKEEVIHRRPNNGISGTLWLTPSGGIPAATGTPPDLTLGTATCTKCEFWLDGSTWKTRAISPTISATVYNMVPTAIGGNKLVQAKRLFGKDTVDVEPC